MNGKKRKKIKTKNKKPVSDKREYSRLYYHYLTSYRIVTDTYIKQGVGITENMSLGGIMVSLKERIEPNSLLEIDIATKETIITAMTQVRHVAEIGDGTYDVGLVFVDISPNDVEQLKKLLQYD
ncbi:PilZ domain-containing protein [bacterium]|nr:PilZ domain-containing protein [bacterium]